MFPCTPLVYSLGALCSFFIYILLFTDQKKKKKTEELSFHYFCFHGLLFLFQFQILCIKNLSSRLNNINNMMQC